MVFQRHFLFVTHLSFLSSLLKHVHYSSYLLMSQVSYSVSYGSHTVFPDKLGPERQSGISHVFFVWRACIPLPGNTLGLSLTYLDIHCSLRGEFVWRACIPLPGNTLGLSLTYLDIHCSLRGELITVTYTTSPVKRSQCCGTL